jgi:hypothetical protein
MTDADRKAIDTLQEIEITFSVSDPRMKDHFRTALVRTLEAFLGVREIGTTNKGFWIDKFHKESGLRPGYPWCMMFLQYAYRFVSRITGLSDIIPFNTAGTQAFAQWGETNGYCRTNMADVTIGDLIVWRNGSSSQGHVAAIVDVSTDHGNVYSVTTIEGNTSSADYRDGGTIAEKHYSIAPAELGAKKRGRWIRCIVSVDALLEAAEVVK